MILDNEEQRKRLLALIEVAPVQGAIGQVRETIKAMDTLKGEITSAAIAQKPQPDQKPNQPLTPPPAGSPDPKDSSPGKP